MPGAKAVTKIYESRKGSWHLPSSFLLQNSALEAIKQFIRFKCFLLHFVGTKRENLERSPLNEKMYTVLYYRELRYFGALSKADIFGSVRKG